MILFKSHSGWKRVCVFRWGTYSCGLHHGFTPCLHTPVLNNVLLLGSLALSSLFLSWHPSAAGRWESGVPVVVPAEEASRPGHSAVWGRWPIRGKRWWHSHCALASPQPRNSPATSRSAHLSGALDPGHRWVCKMLKKNMDKSYIRYLISILSKWVGINVGTY